MAIFERWDIPCSRTSRERHHTKRVSSAHSHGIFDHAMK
jgi:hypothetical protein